MKRGLLGLAALVAASGCSSGSEAPASASAAAANRGAAPTAASSTEARGATSGTASGLAADIRVQAVGMPDKLDRATLLDVEMPTIARAIDAQRVALTSCYAGLSAPRADTWIVMRVSAGGAPEGARAVRSAGRKEADACVVGVLEKVAFGASPRPLALSVWLGISPDTGAARAPAASAAVGASGAPSSSAAPSPSTAAPSVPLAACAQGDNVLSFLSVCAGPPSARGDMWGDSIGEAQTKGGLGLSGVGGPPAPGSPETPKHKPPQLRMGATTMSGRLPIEVIQRIVRQNFGRFRLCYEKGLRSDATLAGRVTVSFTIAEDGSVKDATHTTDLADTGTASCVARGFNALSFPRPEDGVVKVTYPITFSPGDAAQKKAVTQVLGIDLDKLTGPDLAKATTRDHVFAASVEAAPTGDVPFVVFAESKDDHYAIARVPDAAPRPLVPALGDRSFTVLVIPAGKAPESLRLLE